LNDYKAKSAIECTKKKKNHEVLLIYIIISKTYFDNWKSRGEGRRPG
jgi:hypothetical protein